MTDIHRTETTVLHQGNNLESANAAVILIHGRGATAESILGLANALDPDGAQAIAWLAPQAEGNTWYPERFTEPVEQHEPHRTNGLHVIDGLIQMAVDAGVAPGRIGLVGFSQGACLALEYAGWGTYTPAFVGALSGGVMGPLEETRSIATDLSGTNVFIGCGDQDGHIPLAHAERSARLLEGAGATVDYRTYPGMGHIINDDEIDALRAAVNRLAGR